VYTLSPEGGGWGGGRGMIRVKPKKLNERESYFDKFNKSQYGH
jgi:hypothetical protein